MQSSHPHGGNVVVVDDVIVDVVRVVTEVVVVDVGVVVVCVEVVEVAVVVVVAVVVEVVCVVVVVVTVVVVTVVVVVEIVVVVVVCVVVVVVCVVVVVVCVVVVDVAVVVVVVAVVVVLVSEVVVLEMVVVVVVGVVVEEVTVVVEVVGQGLKTCFDTSVIAAAIAAGNPHVPASSSAPTRLVRSSSSAPLPSPLLGVPPTAQYVDRSSTVKTESLSARYCVMGAVVSFLAASTKRATNEFVSRGFPHGDCINSVCKRDWKCVCPSVSSNATTGTL